MTVLSAFHANCEAFFVKLTAVHVSVCVCLCVCILFFCGYSSPIDFIEDEEHTRVCNPEQYSGLFFFFLLA